MGGSIEKQGREGRHVEHDGQYSAYGCCMYTPPLFLYLADPFPDVYQEQVSDKTAQLLRLDF